MGNGPQSVLSHTGKLFQTRSAATEKRRLPDFVVQQGTVSRFSDDERRHHWDS